MSTSVSYWTLRNRYSPPLQRPCLTGPVTADAAQLAAMVESLHVEQQQDTEGPQGAPQEPQTEESQMSHHKKKVM